MNAKNNDSISVHTRGLVITRYNSNLKIVNNGMFASAYAGFAKKESRKERTREFRT
jgi:hypothetical protein